MIKLVDFLGITADKFKDYKLHFAIGTDEKKDPYNKFLLGEFDDFQAIQTNKNFNR